LTLILGIVASGLYIASASIVWRAVPVRILYEGDAPPPPYRWVQPPPNLSGDNEAPLPGAGTVMLAPTGSRPGSTTTGDGQASIVFPEGSIAPRAGESRVEVRVTPLSPATLGPPPQGLRFHGNAYRVEAFYATSRDPVALSRPATMVVRYPVHATELLRLAGGTWTNLRGQTVPETLQIFTNTDRLGTFVPAAAP
jgi:hypothetical protein